MLVFVIPLVSPKVANSWDRVSQLFERCIRSVCNQTSLNFRVVVVCNEKPTIEFSHPHITYIKVDFLPEGSDFKAKTLDRGRKVLTGLLWAQHLEPSHVMAVDADDCVSKHLAKFVEQNSQCHGWFINKGYVYKDGSNLLYRRWKNFNIFCGTCNIIKFNLYDLCQNSDSKTKEFILKYHGGHKYILENLAKQGIILDPLPFPGAIYIVENGENYYLRSFNKIFVPKNVMCLTKSLKNYRLATNSIRKEFGLYTINA